MRLTYQILYSIAFFSVCFASLFSKKLREGLLGRRNLLERLRVAIKTQPVKKRVVWFHLASAGEFEQALPLLDELRSQEPLTFIALTYFSPSGERAVALETARRQEFKLAVCWDFADFLPLDFSFSLGRFFETLKPHLLIILNKELWPQLIWTANDKDIPCFLWLSHFKEMVPRWMKPLLSGFVDLGVVNQKSYNLLKQSNPDLPVRKVGDTRLERIIFRKEHFFNHQHSSNLPAIPSPSVIAASFWEEDFKALCDALSLLSDRGFSFPLVIVPHEPDPVRIMKWRKMLSEKLINQFSVLFIDRVGILAELYSKASIMIVGGSFKKKIHNVLEPLAYQARIISGPFFLNSSEAIDLFNQGILRRVTDGSSLAQELHLLMTNNILKEELKQKTIKYLNSYSKCSAEYLTMVKEY